MVLLISSSVCGMRETCITPTKDLLFASLSPLLHPCQCFETCSSSCERGTTEAQHPQSQPPLRLDSAGDSEGFTPQHSHVSDNVILRPSPSRHLPMHFLKALYVLSVHHVQCDCNCIMLTQVGPHRDTIPRLGGLDI